MLSLDEGSELAECIADVIAAARLECAPLLALDRVRWPCGTYVAITCGFSSPGEPCPFGDCKDEVARDIGRWLRERYGDG